MSLLVSMILLIDLRNDTKIFILIAIGSFVLSFHLLTRTLMLSYIYVFCTAVAELTDAFVLSINSDHKMVIFIMIIRG